MQLLAMFGPLLIALAAVLWYERHLKTRPEPRKPQATPLLDKEREILRQRMVLAQKRDAIVEWLGDRYVNHPRRLRGEVQ